MKLKLNVWCLVQLTEDEVELDEAEDKHTEERKEKERKKRKMRSCNYPKGKVKTFGRVFIISFISESRTNRAVFCEIVLERLHRPL